MTSEQAAQGPHQVLYRKWRPQTLEQVVGQEHITQTLLNALERERVGHAYLFTGPRGTGKTSTARILAKAINCEATGGTGEPCNECEPCKQITDASFLDLVEIDGASNRGIDEIRDLREKVRFMPARGRKKVYIIDEVHMLTAAAFNALLKTLEEPPDHVVFLLATTEPHAVPLTIASRCQRFDFQRIPEERAASLLGEISHAEGLKIEPEALNTVVKASGGSLRDAENLLEQLALTAGADATATDARRLFGIAGSGRARELIASLLGEKDLAAALRGLSGLHAAGVDMRQIHRELVNELRALMLVRAGAADVLDISDDEKGSARELAEKIELPVIRHALGQIAPLSVPSGSAPLPLEMAFAGISLSAETVQRGAAEGPQAAQQERSRVGETRETPPPARQRQQQPEPQQRAPQQQAEPQQRAPQQQAEPQQRSPEPQAEPQQGAPQREQEQARPSPARTEPEYPRTGTRQSPMVAQRQGGAEPFEMPPGELTLETLRQNWRELVNGLRGVGSGGNLDAYLRSVSQPLAIENGDTIVIGFAHDFQKNKIDDPKYRHLVEQRFAVLLGKHYTIRCEKVGQEERGGHLVRAAQEMGGRVVSGGDKDEGDDS